MIRLHDETSFYFYFFVNFFLFSFQNHIIHSIWTIYGIKTNQFCCAPQFIEHDPRSQHDKHEQTLPLTIGLDSEQTLSTQEANQKAIEALSYVLRNLPNKMKYTDQSNGLPPTIDTDNIIFDKRPPVVLPPTQYKIPNDPAMTVRIPEFKPLNSITSTYTLSLGPIESVTTKHLIGGPSDADDTIGTVLATSYSNKQVVVQKPQNTIKNKFHPPPPAPPSLLRLPSPKIQQTLSAHTQQLPQPPPPPPPPHHTVQNHSHTINAQPLDLYHTMSLKHDPVKSNFISIPHQLQKHRLVSHAPLPPYKPLHSPQFEIQKSIEYQLH